MGGHKPLGDILCLFCTSVNDSSKGEPKPIWCSWMFELVSNQWLYKSVLKPVGNYSKEERRPEWAVLPTFCKAPMGNPLQDRSGAILSVTPVDDRLMLCFHNRFVLGLW